MRMRIAPVIVVMIVYANSIPTNMNLISVTAILYMNTVFPTYVDRIALLIALNVNAIGPDVNIIALMVGATAFSCGICSFSRLIY